MKNNLNTSTRASALPIALAISLFSISSILLASSFADALGSRGREPSTSAREPGFVTTSKGSAAVNNEMPATTCTVTSTADSGPGTLRDCLANANDGDTITFAVTGTITLTSGELVVSHSVTISGPSAANLTVDGNATSRVFHIFASNVTISGLTIQNGLGTQGGGLLIEGNAGLTVENCTVSNNVSGPGCCYEGGGIFNQGTLTVSNSTISGNSSTYDGGGIDNEGTLTVSNSTISGNSAVRDGGGIDDNGSGPTMTISNSTISGNSAPGGGGISSIAQFNNASLTVLNSTISGNSATSQPGGGIYNGGNATVSNSTISGNSASGTNGGGIANGSVSLTVKDCTFSGNSSSSPGGAIFNWLGGTTQIGDTVLNAGASGGTLFNNSGAITSLGYNLASDNGGGFLTGSGDQINTDPMLGPLQDNGGPTFTHALLPGSPAIDHGDPNFAPPPDDDQRGQGYLRVVNGRIDIGSFEVQTNPPLLFLNAVSRKTQGGAGTFDINLPLSGEPGVECRNGGGNYTEVFTFTNNVVSGSAAVTGGTGSVSGNPTFSNNTMTVQLAGVTDVQRITVTLTDVTDVFSHVLPPTSVSMNVLIGDTNGDRTVNSTDVAQVKSQVGRMVTGSNFREDVNADGLLSSSDVALTKSKVGHGLP